MKTKIFISALSILLLSALFMTKSVNAQDLLPAMNVKVLQHLSTLPAEGVWVEYWKDGIRVKTGTTDGNGLVNWTAATGTYDVYVYYPAPPNDGQSGQLLGHFHNNPEMVTISLGPNY